MVYVNSKKYACESCIKGHRSSSCHHNDRPLFEIKKKGRPVSQCEKCREARQARRIHAKCTCELEKGATLDTEISNVVKKKGMRFIPSVPSLPNGLRDALQTSTPSLEGTGSKQPVDALLNPCHCKDVYNCKCRPRVNLNAVLGGRPSKPVDPAIFSDGLSALALVAACCSPAAPSRLPSVSTLIEQPKRAASGVHSGLTGRQEPPSPHNHETSGMRESGRSKRKRSPRSSPIPSDVTRTNSNNFRAIAAASSGLRNQHWRLEPSVPPCSHLPAPPSIHSSGSVSTATVSGDTKAAGAMNTSHCCCGTRCECAGCEQHGRPRSVSSQPSWVDDPSEASSSTAPTPVDGHGVDCSLDCPTCIDYDGGVELPSLSSFPGVASSPQTPAPPYLAAFLARAASLPRPPAHSRSSLDPTNVVVYPAGLFKRPRGASESAGRGIDEDVRPRAFGLVRIPKLEECCGGRCGCAEDACGCGDKCDGCCMDGVERTSEVVGEAESLTTDGERPSPSVSFARSSQEVTPPPTLTPSASAAKSCCQR